MAHSCPHCGAANRPQSHFCQRCGQPLSGQAAPVAPPRQRPWRRWGGLLLLVLCLSLITWWGVTRRVPTPFVAGGSEPSVAVGVLTPTLVGTSPTAVGATPTNSGPPTPSPTPEPLLIPGTDIALPRLSDAEEIAIGEEVAQEVEAEYGVLHDAAAQQRVESIGQRIVPYSDRPGLVYHFTLLDTDEVNAFAAPGGFIFVTRGMLAFANPAPDDELASVIGHEIAHVARRHGAKQIERITLAIAALEAVVRRNQDWAQIYQTEAAQITQTVVGELLVRGWGRNQEFDADHYGVLYMKQAGYNPNAAITLFLRMQNAFQPGNPGPAERLLSTHPPFPDRIARIETVLNENP